MYVNERNAILLLIGAIIATAFITTHPAQAETGKDVFRVIMTILYNSYPTAYEDKEQA